MSAVFRKVQPGWLSRSMEDARRYVEENKEWADQIRGNWKESGSRESETFDMILSEQERSEA